jgi:hypothetical protein
MNVKHILGLIPDLSSIRSILQNGSNKDREQLLNALHNAFKYLPEIAVRLGYDKHLAVSALHEMILALTKNVLSGSVAEGNFKAYASKIFWNKIRDLNASFYTKVHQNNADIDDFWLLPIPESDPDTLFEQGYQIVLQLFDKIDSCRRDRCREICTLKIETEWSTQDILEHLDEVGIVWDTSSYENRDSPDHLKIRNQRLRDRIAHCWARLRKALQGNNINDDDILYLLKR